jgi:large subunit ribosomal protein L15
MPHKLKKSRKQRGSRYCGWGQVGQHRKGGSRGGKGKAGGKKHFWIQTVKFNPNRYKKKGFKPPSSLGHEVETVNVGELKALAIKTLGMEILNSEAKELTLDLKSLGFQKLLGRGTMEFPLSIKVSEFSSKALEKVEAAGGQIVEPE